jgi:hypothetical protein
MGLDSHVKSIVGRIRVCFMYPFIINHTGSSIEWHLALVQTLAFEWIHQTIDKLILKERQQPPMQLLHDVSYSQKLLVVVSTSYIFSSYNIPRSLHLLPQTPQTDDTPWN